MNQEELYRRFKETGQEQIRLETALKGFFAEKKCGEGKYTREYESYLKRRIRPSMECLIEAENVEKIEYLEQLGWFDGQKIDDFIRIAGERHRQQALVCLLRIKNEKYGYKDKDFTL